MQTKNLGTDPVLNSNKAKNALRCAAISESDWTVLSKSHKTREEIPVKYFKKLGEKKSAYKNQKHSNTT